MSVPVELQDRLLAGDRVVCPCCEQSTQIMYREIHEGMARFIRALARLHYENPGPHHVRDVQGGEKASTDASYLTRWQLVTREGRGKYRLTEQGRRWAQDAVAVPAGVFLYNGEPLCWTPWTATWSEAMRTRFQLSRVTGWGRIETLASVVRKYQDGQVRGRGQDGSPDD
jgi:hypothetical protein